MKKLLASASVLVFAASAMAQDSNCNQHFLLGYDDGGAENSWKISAPSGPSDYFNVDLRLDANGKTLTAIRANSNETGGIGGTWNVGVYENCIVGVPDLSSPVCVHNGATVNAGDGCGDNDCYSVPCCALGSPTFGHSVVAGLNPGDSHIWMCSDSTLPVAGRSFFSTNGYAACTSIPFTVNWMLGVGIEPASGTLMVNGGSSASVAQDGGSVCFVFYGPTLNTQGIFFLIVPAVIKIITVPTDGFAPGPCPNSWALCATFSCASPTFSNFGFGHFYFDTLHLKANGKPAILLSNLGYLTITPSGSCVPNYGQKDDCVLDATIWKVQNPAAASDWFNVNHGTTNGVGVSTVTGIEISSWDFCGNGPSWAEVGIYRAASFDVCTPDLGNPKSTISNAAMAPAAGDWGCPLTFYDIPDFSSNTGVVYHVAAKWQAGDSCTWLGSDTDGVDSGLGTPIPNNGCCSLFSLDNYTTSAVRFTGANWMMQIKWN